jgi:hypothetical protein
VVARKGCADATPRELRAAVDRCWHELLRKCNASFSS